MKLSTQIKPISYIKIHAPEVIRQVGEEKAPFIITQNGEAKVIMQDIQSFEGNQETMALLKVLTRKSLCGFY